MIPQAHRAVRRATLLLLGVAGAVLLRAADAPPDAIVAADGTGNYRSVQEAISAAPMTIRPPMKMRSFLTLSRRPLTAYLHANVAYVATP